MESVRTDKFESKTPVKCKTCGVATENRVFCSRSCSATYNNKAHPKRVKQTRPCRRCGAQVPDSRRYWCSPRCGRAGYVDRWLAGEETGLRPDGHLTKQVVDYVRGARGTAACWTCGWAALHPVTGKIPTQVDHIDGNWENARPSNLRLLCPNCHSLTETWGALNKGNNVVRTRLRRVP